MGAFRCERALPDEPFGIFPLSPRSVAFLPSVDFVHTAVSQPVPDFSATRKSRVLPVSRKTRVNSFFFTRSTARTTSGKSSAVGGESEDESRLDIGDTSGVAAPGNGAGLASASDAASSDHPAAPSAAGNHVNGRSSSSSRRAASRGGERERGRATMEEWGFERLAGTQLLASAFEEFSRKALCHESWLFLIEVAR